MPFHHEPLLIVAAIILIIFAIVIRLYVHRREFYRRRGWGRFQVFNTYTESIVLPLYENLLILMGTLSVFAAGFALLLYFA